jgi:hypothetical protein
MEGQAGNGSLITHRNFDSAKFVKAPKQSFPRQPQQAFQPSQPSDIGTSDLGDSESSGDTNASGF